jgi:NADPH-dependent curcumin reductase CurA
LAEQGFDLFVGELFVLNRPFRHERPLNEMHGQVQVKGWIDFTAGDCPLQRNDRRPFRLHANRPKLRREFRVLHRPLSFEEAAALPMAGVTALQGLRDKANVHRGQTVLINGASGGVGTFAVQIARAYGASVTAVCSTRHVELVQSHSA